MSAYLQIICTSTAFIILLSDAYKQPGFDGIALTQAALRH